MQMDGWADHLHTSFYGEHVLFHGLRLTSFPAFIVAAALSASICLLERSLTFALSRHWIPFHAVRQSRVRSALWRAALYSLATLLRLLYMLLSMTFHVWLILIIVLSLGVGQFLIEYYEQPSDHRNAYYHLSSSPPRMRKAYAKTKPAGLFIHPNHSNIARADAVAAELGLRSQTERPQAPRTSSDSDGTETERARDRGHETARALLGATTQQARATNVRSHSKSDSQQHLFDVGDSGGESDG